MKPTRYVATIGLHASASTWVFNVAREFLVLGAGPAGLLTIYTESLDQVPCEAAIGSRHLLLKSHHGSPALEDWLVQKAVTVVLSVRDPRDAAISMAQRFNTRLDRAIPWIANDCARLARLADRGFPLFRYEDRFFDRPAAVAQIAGMIGLTPKPATILDIFNRYRTESVRSFGENLAALPPGRVVATPVSKLDSVTQIHATHIGDARTGKWRDLPPATQAAITTHFAPFLRRFGYDAMPRPL